MSKRTLILIMAIIGLSGFALTANGTGRNKGPVINNEYNEYNTYVLEDCFVGGANIALDNIHPDRSANKHQIGLGIGHSCNEFGGAIGYARREGAVLWSGSAAYDDINKEQFGGAMNLSF